jgi:hypothetical protein
MSSPFRPPAVPLVTHDPYFSAWSVSDALTGTEVRHWTGTNYGLCGLARLDGQAFRCIGTFPRDVPAMEQTGLEVTPTRTVYTFEAAGVRLTLSFLSPLLPHDLDVLARPVTYITWEAQATDGAAHDVSVYLHVQGEWVVNTADQAVVSARFNQPDLDVLRMGSARQPILETAGDNVRIDWGYVFLAVPRASGGATALIEADPGRAAFVQTGTLPPADQIAAPRPAHDGWPVLACALPLGPVGDAPVARHVLLAYDDVFSLEYFHRKVRPFWRRDGQGVAELLATAEREYGPLAERCAAFDAEVTADLKGAGGDGFAALCALAFRQCLAAHKLAADLDGTPLFLSKENFSNGCIGTVDVTYPSAPFFLLFNPALLRAMLTPILDYARTPRWRFPFAPHDLGTYPLANGQVYGGGERSEQDQMPVEECGNMLILLAALTQAEGHAEYVRGYWPLLTGWAEYLRAKGLNPENQLCTDDFAGHLAHNVNLSLKAILGLGCFARMCEQTGRPADAEGYRRAAQAMADDWVRMADDGDHFRLTFDGPGTWSQKYNLVWDSLLGLNLFPPDVARREVAFYKTKQNIYGLPLDSRSGYTKLDWIVWSATLAEDPADFAALTDPLYAWMNETPARVPLTDWYWTTDGKQAGFQARSVVGGLYLPLLKDPALWRKWAARARPPA